MPNVMCPDAPRTKRSVVLFRVALLAGANLTDLVFSGTRLPYRLPRARLRAASQAGKATDRLPNLLPEDERQNRENKPSCDGRMACFAIFAPGTRYMISLSNDDRAESTS